MKTIFLSSFLALCYQASYGQACQEITLFDNAQRRSIVRDYINDCRKNHYFIEDKGIASVIVYKDSNGRMCWYLSSLIDNRFLAAPPSQYAWFDNDVVLVYNGDNTGKIIEREQNKTALGHCLVELVGSRVYTYTDALQYAFYVDDKGNKIKITVKHDENGNIHNDIIIIFNADGTITKKIPA